MNEFPHISINPEICGGKPCVKGTRIPVYMVLELVEAGISFDEIVRDYYAHITEDHIRACVEYAIALIQNEEVHFAEELPYADTHR